MGLEIEMHLWKLDMISAPPFCFEEPGLSCGPPEVVGWRHVRTTCRAL